MNIGLAIVLFVNLALWPENSTETFVMVLDDAFSQLDDIFSEHVARFLRRGPQRPATPLPAINGKLQTVVMNVVDAKRVIRREATINRLAPADVRDITNLVKNMRVAVQGIVLASSMQKNMDSHLELEGARFVRIDTFRSEIPPALKSESSTDINMQFRQVDENNNNESDLDTWPDDHGSFDQSEIFPPEQYPPKQRKGSRLEDILESYEQVIEIIEPMSSDLANACSVALKDSIAKLKKTQDYDPRYHNRPFFYRFLRSVRHTYHPEDDDLHIDRSAQLLDAIKRFEESRLKGLEKLMRSDEKTPHRALFLILLFQFNLRDYAEKLYTLSSLTYEIYNIRKKRRLWFKHVSIRKFLLGRKHDGNGDLGLDAPQTATDEAAAILSRSRSRTARSASVSHPSDSLPTLRRGRARSFRHPKARDRANGLRRVNGGKPSTEDHNPLDALEYKDPDAMLPSNRFEHFCYTLWLHRGLIYSPEVAFAFKACILVVLLSFPAFIESSMNWYADSLGEWAVVTALVWMGPSIGSNIFG